MRGKALVKIALAALGAAVLALSALVYGVVSVSRQNRAYDLAVYLIHQQRRLGGKPVGETGRRGLWHKARDVRDTSASNEQASGELAALPYLSGYKAAPAKKDVTVHDESAAYPGVNFIVSADAPRAFLMDMKGNVLHEWRKEFASVWPDPPQDAEGNPIYKTFWRRAKPLANGGLLAIFMDFGLIRLDRESKLVWAYPGRCHHDVFATPTGEIYVLTREVRKRDDLRLESWRAKRPILEDFITILDPQGKEVRKVSILDSFLNSDYAPMLENVKSAHDVLHANTIKPILVDRPPLFKKGRVLVSLREIHTLAVVDLEEQKVTWAATGMWKFQHEPNLLANGNLLLFDNRGNNGRSRAIEFDPLTREIVWSYRGEPADAFYSREAGSLERLPNGNTLITESESGRGFEVTPKGRIAWEFYNPHRAGEDRELIAALYDVIRLGQDQVGWLAPVNAKTD
jgi:hypothetical protein